MASCTHRHGSRILDAAISAARGLMLHHPECNGLCLLPCSIQGTTAARLQCLPTPFVFLLRPAFCRWCNAFVLSRKADLKHQRQVELSNAFK